MSVLVLPLVLPIALPFRLCCSLLCSCMKAPSSVWHEYRQPSNDHRAHLSSSKRKWEGAAALREGPWAAQLSLSAELLCSSPWNLAILCDLPLNPECLGHWPSHSWPCPVQPVPASFHSIALPV